MDPIYEVHKRVLCLWFPNWAIQQQVVSEPEFRRQRMVLFRRDSRRGQVVSAASPLAMQEGARVGMSISEAKSLLRRGGNFHVFEHDLDADLTAIEQLADSLEGFSPVVGLEPIDRSEHKAGRRPDSIFLDVTGLAHLFGDENQLARQLLVHCDQLGYLPRVAVADTVGGSWAMARFFSGPYFAQHQQPVVLPPADQELIAQLPVESLRLSADTVDTLGQLGIETIGQLQRLSRNDLAMRFGNTIHRRLDQLTGKLDEPVIARRKPAAFVAEQLLEYPTSHRETIEVVIARLVAQLGEQMRSRQQGALEWSIRLACQSESPIEFCVNLFQPTATTEHVMPLVEMQLEQALSPHLRTRSRRYTTIQVNEITVSVTSNVLLAQHQRQLFDENPRLDRQSLAQLINRLASRVGSHNVVYPMLQSGAQPEYSFRLKPLVDANRRVRKRTTPPKQSHALARPLRLFHPPIRLKTFSKNAGGDAGDSLGGCEIALPNESQTIISSCGPERIETGWWRGVTVCRDYWRIETEAHQHFWVYRDLRSGVWFLHGEF